MRKIDYFLGLCLLLFIFASCEKKKEFNPELLSGKWQQGTLFEYYESNGNGHTWDESDDVTEDEAQPFTWTLENDRLTQVHLMTNGVKIPKPYTVTELTSTRLQYHDDYNKSYSFTKVN